MTFFPYLLATALAVGFLLGIVSGIRAGIRKPVRHDVTDYDLVVDIESCNEL